MAIAINVATIIVYFGFILLAEAEMPVDDRQPTVSFGVRP